MTDTLAPLLQTAIASGKIAGANAIIANADGLLAEGCAGVADPATDADLTMNTVFQIASMTKAIVSVAAMQLVEQGLLSLDDDIGGLLPELANPHVMSGFDDAGQPQLRPAARAITLRRLLCHTSGLGYAFMSAEMARAQAAAGGPAPGTLASLISPLLFDPGDRWEYGISTDWVGRAVEELSGMRLGAYLAQHITGPLGMTDTAFDMTPEQAARRAALQARTPDGALMPFPVEIGGGESREFDGGGGGLMSTAPDYIRFLRMLLCKGELDGVRILKAETVAEMARNQIGALRAGEMNSIMPAFSGHYDIFPGQHTGWGLGFAINPEPGPHGRAPGSLAWAGIANSYFWIDPASDRTGVVMMQFLPFGDQGALDVYAAVERAAYQ